MLHEIGPGIFDNKYFNYQEVVDDDFLLCYRDNEVLLKKSGDEYEIPRKSDFTASIEAPVYLFSINSNHCFEITESSKPIATIRRGPCRSLR